MASPTSSFSSAWWLWSSSSSTALSSGNSLASSTTPEPVLSPPSVEPVPSPSSYETARSPVPPFVIPVSPTPFDIDNVMEDFPPAQIVDYHQTQGREVDPPPPQSTDMVLYNPETPRWRPSSSRDQDQDNLQELLGQLVREIVYKEVSALMKEADAEIVKAQQAEHDSSRRNMEEASELTKEADELIVEAQQANHESPRRTNMELAVNTRPGRSATKQVANISDLSFQLPQDFEVDDDTVNQFVPKNEVIREIIAQSSKKYSFSDRLHGWKMECRIRLNGRQLDKYFTHVQSKVVARSVPEVVRFILYEVNPKQMREANKRKAIELGETAESPQKRLKDENSTMPSMSSQGGGIGECESEDEDETYEQMFCRVAWSNQMNGTAEKVPLLSEWEQFKAAKKKARTTPSQPDVVPPNPDAEAVETANALVELLNHVQRPSDQNPPEAAGDEISLMRRPVACIDMSGFGVFIRQ